MVAGLCDADQENSQVTKLEAPAAMKRQFEKMRKAEGIHAFLKAVERQAIQQRLPPRKPSQKHALPAAPDSAQIRENLGVPTPERAEKAAVVVKTEAPPFNARIFDALQQFAKQLGPEAILILEQFYAAGIHGMSSRGLVASYDMLKIDMSRTDYSHLGMSEQEAHDRFLACMHAMPIEMRKLAEELIFENMLSNGQGSPRTAIAIGMELSGGEDKRRAHGAAVAFLRMVSWCVGAAMNGVGRKRRTA